MAAAESYFGDSPLVPCPLPRPCHRLRLCRGDRQCRGAGPHGGRKSLEIPSAKANTLFCFNLGNASYVGVFFLFLLYFLFRAEENLQIQVKKPKHLHSFHFHTYVMIWIFLPF